MILLGSLDCFATLAMTEIGLSVPLNARCDAVECDYTPSSDSVADKTKAACALLCGSVPEVNPVRPRMHQQAEQVDEQVVDAHMQPSVINHMVAWFRRRARCG